MTKYYIHTFEKYKVYVKAYQHTFEFKFSGGAWGWETCASVFSPDKYGLLNVTPEEFFAELL